MPEAHFSHLPCQGFAPALRSPVGTKDAVTLVLSWPSGSLHHAGPEGLVASHGPAHPCCCY